MIPIPAATYSLCPRGRRKAHDPQWLAIAAVGLPAGPGSAPRHAPALPKPRQSRSPFACCAGSERRGTRRGPCAVEITHGPRVSPCHGPSSGGIRGRTSRTRRNGGPLKTPEVRIIERRRELDAPAPTPQVGGQQIVGALEARRLRPSLPARYPHEKHYTAVTA